MNSYNQKQAESGSSQAQQQASAFVAPPPPAGYPTRDVQSHSSVPLTTQSRGDGFWKGWLVIPFSASSFFFKKKRKLITIANTFAVN